VIGTTEVVVDSASYLPVEVHERFGLWTVPLRVTLDDVEYREFVDLDTATFYRALAAGAKVSTSQPSPGDFLRVYEAAARAGAERILSIHISGAMSGTVNSARLASEMIDIPVEIIDTGQVSFIEGLCAWEACEALASGAAPGEISAVVQRAAAAAGNVFLVRGLELLKRGGRFASGADFDGVPILALMDGAIRPIGQERDVESAIDAIVAHFDAAARAAPWKRFRVGVSNGDCDELAAMLEQRLRDHPAMAEVMQYTIGPVVGAHTGAGCTGAVFLPRPI
jgi:DegV family protein with EDD domain